MAASLTEMAALTPTRSRARASEARDDERALLHALAASESVSRGRDRFGKRRNRSRGYGLDANERDARDCVAHLGPALVRRLSRARAHLLRDLE